MKKAAIILLLVFLAHPAAAQEETLFSGGFESGGYGGFFVKFGQIVGESAIFMGGQGGWVINHRFVIGGKGYGLIDRVEVSPNIKLEFGCWGGLLEYIIASNKIVHASIQSMIGAGGVRYAVIDHGQPHAQINYSEDAFFVLEPGVHLVLNVNKFFRIAAGATYRYVTGVEYEDLTNSDLSGLSGEVVFKFGLF